MEIPAMLKNFLTLPIVVAIMTTVLGPCAATGCTGFEPGPAGRQESTVPTPLGTFVLSGERDFTLSARNVVGVPGSPVPSMETLDITRNASLPIRTRADAALAIELQRQQFTERLLMQMFQASLQGLAAYQEYKAAQPPPTPGPSRADQARELLAILREAGLLQTPTTAPAPSP